MSEGHASKMNVRTLKLVESVFDNTITAGEFEELVDQLNNDSQAVATYVEYVNLHSGLRQAYLSDPAIEPEQLDSAVGGDLSVVLAEKSRDDAKRLSKFLGLAVAAMLLLGIGLLVRKTPAKLDPQETAAAAPTPEETSTPSRLLEVERVAVITRQHDVVWEQGAEVRSLDEPLARQRIDIRSGLMQIEFYCGAAVIVEGPASFEVVSPDRGYAHFGKLRAHVPARAHGFTIGTKSGDIVDLGTEFGLEISDEGGSELHVIDGEVDFQGSDDAADASKRLIGGQAMKLDSEDVASRMLDSNADRFKSPAEFQKLANQKDLAKFERWIDYHAQLRQDPSLVADYRFNGSQGWGRTLVNVAPGADEESYGAVVGASWQRGRFKQSQALRFDSPSDRVRLKIDGEFDALTLATWVKVQEFEDVHHVALLHPEISRMGNPADEGQKFIHWSLVRAQYGAVLHFSESRGHGLESRNHYGSIAHGVNRADLGKWVHLALVYDPDVREVAHYRNGELLRALPIESPRPIGIGTGNLGNWPYQDWAEGTPFEYRNLNGLMDEFVILSRAMSGGEIHEMYEAGRP